MRFGFAASAPFGASVLERLAVNHEIAFCVTQPDAPAGRGRGLRPAPAKLTALKLGIPVVESLDAPLDAETIVLVAFGRLIPSELLERHLWLNAHPSLLPRWRGAAPIQRAIMAGDEETGVTIMRMAEGLDTGPMCLEGRGPISATTTAGNLHDSLMHLGASLMAEALAKLGAGKLECLPQPDQGATYAKKIDKAESEIDFTRPAIEVRNHIYGLSPFPGAWFLLDQEGRTFRIKVHLCDVVDGKGNPGEVIDDKLAIACGDGAVRLTSLQREGKSAMGVEEFLRGFSVPKGTVVG